MAYTQDNRQTSVTTPLGKDVLLLKGFSGTEGISSLFEFDLDLLSEVNPGIDFDSIVGKNVTITIKHAGGTRYINGFVSRFSQGAGDPSFASYRAQIVPWLWFLTQTADLRIFQNMTAPDIIKKVFTDLGFTDYKFNLSKTYPPREYCVQYRETDFNFVSRLMEQYGIFYFFEHDSGKHTLILGDTSSAYLACSPSAVRYQADIGAAVIPDDVVTSWAKQQEFRPGKYALNDYNFETPSTKLDVTAPSLYPAANPKFEVYDYPGEYAKRAEGDMLVRVRMEEEECQRDLVSGAGGCPQFTAGFTMNIKGNARTDFDGDYMLKTVTHIGSEHAYDSSRDDDDFAYSNTFTCIPAKIQFRPPRLTPKPTVLGSQTAEVVGVKGEEIYTDKFGRVKVQFHWDREGKKDENSSCWIRVSHPWAGKGWGSVAIPRIGQEVVVDFLEGDPDQPLIVGRVYNGEVMPPYTLPAGGVVSGLKSNSTKGGGGFNEISMDDTKGKEKITIHGQYDLNSVIEHDQSWTVKNNDTQKVVVDRTITVDGKHTETIKGDMSMTSSAGNITVTSSSGHVHVTAKTDIKLEVGASKMEMKADGTIKIEGVNISVNGTAIGMDGTAEVRIHGGQVTSEADTNHNTKGAIVMSDGSGTNTVKGGMVMLNP